MTAEEDRRRAEDVRRALGEFLDRLARSVAEGLARSRPVDRPARRQSEVPPSTGSGPPAGLGCDGGGSSADHRP